MNRSFWLSLQLRGLITPSNASARVRSLQSAAHRSHQRASTSTLVTRGQSSYFCHSKQLY
nr:hypothetical protein Iba_scaffold470845CG0010 [Ipomoea batatas]